jgi:glutathione S-transferase
MIKVVSSTICPFVQRVTALLEQKKIPYGIEYISLLDKPDWFIRISPNAQVPILVTESGAALFESDAIVEYLEEAYPALQPSADAEMRAMHRAWSYLATRNYLVQCAAQRSVD